MTENVYCEGERKETGNFQREMCSLIVPSLHHDLVGVGKRYKFSQIFVIPKRLLCRGM